MEQKMHQSVITKQFIMVQTVLITGAAKRIGRSIAERFAAEGWEVILHFNSSRKEAEFLSEDLRAKYPGRLFPIVQADLTQSTEAIVKLLDKLPEGIITLDCLINNASVFDPGLLGETDYQLLRQQMSVNFETPFLLMQKFCSRFGKGNIVNILDTRVVNNDSSYGAYSLSKKALMQATKMAALEWAPFVRVNGLAPGPVLPPPGKDASSLNAVIADTPLKKAAGLDNLTDSVYFLVSNSAVTGQVIFCDSGAHLL
jgi:pteridine reductase